jgi:hypothetical protein
VRGIGAQIIESTAGVALMITITRWVELPGVVIAKFSLSFAPST